jgi:hypothetical protein
MRLRRCLLWLARWRRGHSEEKTGLYAQPHSGCRMLPNAEMELYSVSTALSMASDDREAIEVAVAKAVVGGIAKFMPQLAPGSGVNGLQPEATVSPSP